MNTHVYNPKARKKWGMENGEWRIKKRRRRPFSILHSQFYILPLCLCASGVRAEPGAGGPEPASRPADKTEDDDLSKRLIKRAVAGGEADLMAQIMELMSQAQERLSAKLDPGAETQELQKRAIERLDQAIKKAIQQRRRSSAQSAQSQGERRQMPGRSKTAPGEGEQDEAADAPDPNATGVGRGDAKPSDKLRGPLMESRRGWGHLPKRDRDELLQGMDEEVIERYRGQIDQYYRALGEQEEAP